MASETPLLRVLLLSDLRRVAPRGAVSDWQRPLLDALTAHIAGLTAAGEGPDLIAVAGDLSASAKPEELKAATAWLDELRRAAGLEPERLAVVPGERDVDPDGAARGQPLVEHAIKEGEPGIAALLADEASRRFVLQRLQTWTKAFPSSTPDVPWWRRAFDVRGQPVEILGLCSAWGSSGQPGEQALVGLAQVNALTDGLPAQALRVALVHHPVTALVDFDRSIDAPLQARVDLLLSGHEDQPRQRGPSTPEPRPAYVEVGAGPLSTTLGGPGHAALVEVHPTEVRVGPLVLKPEGWALDRTATQTPSGYASLTRRTRAASPRPSRPAPAPPPPAPRPLPTDPYPVLAPYEDPRTFGGRARDLESLLHALSRERLVWTVYAPSGTGKSSLLRAGLIPKLAEAGQQVALWDQPLVRGLGARLLGQLGWDGPPISDDAPAGVAAALAELRDRRGHRPVLILDQFEEVFADNAALGTLGDLLAASAVAPAGRAARWVLCYRDDFHGLVQDWLTDLRRFPSRLDEAVRATLPFDLSGAETREVWSLPLMGEARGAADRLGVATEAFRDAIRRPLDILDPDGLPHYPWHMAEADALRLASAFAKARLDAPGDPLTPELQVVLDRLLGGRAASRAAPQPLIVPDDPAELERLIHDAIGAHLRRKLAEVCDQGPTADAVDRRTAAMLLLIRLVDEQGRRRAVPKAELLAGDTGPRARLLAQLGRRGVWLVREELRDGVLSVTLPHDRVAAEVHRIQGDPAELQKYKVDPAIVALWSFVLQRSAALRSGDESAAELSWRRFQELELSQEALPWDDATRAWWEAAGRARARTTRSWLRWGALIGLALAVLLSGVWVRLDKKDLEGRVRSAAPASGDPLRALHTLMERYGYDGAELAALLGASSEAGFDADKRDELFGLGPAGLSEDERREQLAPLVEALAPHVEGAPNDESFYGALLAAAEAVRPLNEGKAEETKQAVVDAMRKARGAPPSPDPADGSWTIPIAGTFEVGCFRDADDSCLPNQTLHAVTLSPYRVRKFEETLGEYRRFAPDHLRTEGYPDDWPVFLVRWYEATAYAAWLGAALPTESQWEVAARGGCDASDPACDPADYRRAAYFSGPDEAVLSRVGFTAANQAAVFRLLGGQRPLRASEPLSDTLHPLGLVHVHGNVFEWCRDWYAPYPEQPTIDPSGPALPPDPTSRVLRGGSWGGSAASARSAFRSWFVPSYRLSVVGFRLVLLQPGLGGGS